MKVLTIQKDSDPCICNVCVSYCEQRPGWPLPEEVQHLIDKGFGPRLMIDYWVGQGKQGKDIDLLAPAIVGYEGKYAPFIPQGRCTFLTADKRCELHDIGLKPIECRVAHHAQEESIVMHPHEVVAMEWNNPSSQKIVESFITS